MAAEFQIPPLTCSELRKFTDLHRGGGHGGPGVIRCQNFMPAFPDLRLHWGYLEASISQKTNRGAWHGKWSWGDKQLSTTSPDPTCPVQWEDWERARRTGSWDQLPCIPEWPHDAVGFKRWEMSLSYLVDLSPGPQSGRGITEHTQNFRWWLPGREVLSSSSSTCFWCETFIPPHAKCWPLLWMLRNRTAQQNSLQEGRGYLKGVCPGSAPAMLCLEADNPTGGRSTRWGVKCQVLISLFQPQHCS